MSTPDMRVVAENSTNVASWLASSRSRRPYFSLASTTIERPSGVSSASEDSWAASASSCSLTPSIGMNSVACRLPSVIVPVLSSSSTSTSPEASTARPDIASTLRCTRRSMPAMPIAESSAPIVVGMSATSSAIRTVCDVGVCGVDRERAERHDGGHERDREAGEQDVEGDLVRRLAPLGALHERDHAIEERLAGLLGDADHELIREQARAAGHGRAVAAGLADDRRRLAGDGRLVHRADALDHVAVRGDHLARRR